MGFVPVCSRLRRVVIVAGPPGSGKSSYVAARWRRGDVVFDWDELAGALWRLPVKERPADDWPVRELLARYWRETVAWARAWEGPGMLWLIRCDEREAYRIGEAVSGIVVVMAAKSSHPGVDCLVSGTTTIA